MQLFPMTEKQEGYTMKNIKERNKYIELAEVDVLELARDFVWGSNAESKREGQSLYLVHAIAAKHQGKAKVDLQNHYIEVNVPDDNKAACLQEIEEKTGLAFH